MLITPVSELQGVGEKTAAAFKKKNITTVKDLIYFLPYRHEDFSAAAKISDLEPGRVTILASAEKIETKNVRRGMRITTANLSDGESKLKAVWFNQPYRQTQLGSGEQFLFSGNYEFKYNRYQLTNPAVEKPIMFAESEPADYLAPVYSVVKGVKPATLRKIIKSVKPTIAMLNETLPENVLADNKLISRSEAYLKIHFPKTKADIQAAKNRLAFEELFELMLASGLNKQENSKIDGYQIRFDKAKMQQFVKKLPFALTNAQRIAIWDILQDFEKNEPMNRLLQGDVGSGKTVVAAAAAFMAAVQGYQTAIMAPTEILAAQHAESIRGLLEPFGVQVVLLTGSVKGKPRQILLDKIASGAAQVIIGTHALIQTKVEYKNLGFVVVDEQHRFGVKQRQDLLNKAQKMPNLLAMTATPIPRSLQLTVFGELDVSILNEMPAGRKEIKTKIWAPTNLEALYEKVDAEIEKGRQVYFICGLIDDNPDNDRKSVETEYRKLRSTIFKHRTVGVVHGKMKPDEKDAVMQKFAKGEIDILISTTVVEVGVNVPNATVMVIQDADHFGLSQLHQLRGRVGRGSHQSYCYLVTSDSKKPSQRLREIEKSNDGFYLSQVDLDLRGPGEIYGKMQHGSLNLKIANVSDLQLIAKVQRAVEKFIKTDDLSKYKQLQKNVAKYQRLTTLN